MTKKINKSNFIRFHLIQQIFEAAKEKRKACGVLENSFIYFDEPIQFKRGILNRFGKGSFYPDEQVVPVDWASIDGPTLVKALKQIKENKIFVLKQTDAKLLKFRPKYVKSDIS